MFHFLPPILSLSSGAYLPSLLRATEIYHSEVRDVSYRSRGFQRSQEQHCIFHYTVQGCGEVIFQGTPYYTRPGEGFFNIINDPTSGYGYPLDGREPWEFVVLCFDGGNVRQIAGDLLSRQVIYDLSGHTDAFCELCRELSQKPLSAQACLLAFPRLISMLYSPHTSHLVHQFQHIVHRDLLLNPTISGIASELGLSREHLQREYRRLTGVSPAQYLARQRFDKLCYFLSTAITESEIAEKMHFSSVSSMAVFFKRFSGMTPGQYRRRGYVSI